MQDRLTIADVVSIVDRVDAALKRFNGRLAAINELHRRTTAIARAVERITPRLPFATSR